MRTCRTCCAGPEPWPRQARVTAALVLRPPGMGEESRRCCFRDMGSSTLSYRLPTQTTLSLRLGHFFTEDNLAFSEMPR